MGKVYDGMKFYFGIVLADILISLVILFIFVIFILSIIVAHRIKCSEAKPKPTTTSNQPNQPNANNKESAITTSPPMDCVDFVDIKPNINKLGFVFAVMVAIASGVALIILLAPYIVAYLPFILVDMAF